jgi:hypothetical protein
LGSERLQWINTSSVVCVFWIRNGAFNHDYNDYNDFLTIKIYPPFLGLSCACNSFLRSTQVKITSQLITSCCFSFHSWPKQ